jgi:hypothetical protein
MKRALRTTLILAALTAAGSAGVAVSSAGAANGPKTSVVRADTGWPVKSAFGSH